MVKECGMIKATGVWAKRRGERSWAWEIEIYVSCRLYTRSAGSVAESEEKPIATVAGKKKGGARRSNAAGGRTWNVRGTQ